MKDKDTVVILELRSLRETPRRPSCKPPCSQTSLGPSRNCGLSIHRGFANVNSTSESDSGRKPSRPLQASLFFQVEKLRLRIEKYLAFNLQPVKVTVPYLITVPCIFLPNEAESRENSGLKRIVSHLGLTAPSVVCSLVALASPEDF